ncbi:DeoR/GlpR family DNA-binding transcription regulator [Gluconacetobacter tumulisoli]|uniref:DeoR/GlpR transcriptional regulator n=1 Tax=Gluconacetobacter tumulisoli TaxID=1286189 RepID=A0A7W4PNY3_9PROT|nr:DeoR/GlpR family DNA-binding transcription regulator [Gluconacetobacter tumulisoli]MBB2203034.1 DeoR/GlpR transcriptional regulator [Gluconacetobacter tumulisoli]
MKIAAERRERILKHVEAGMTDADDLAATFEVSLSTIRRDLARLSREGVLVRTYGGGTPVSHAAPEQSLAQRADEQVKQKRAIARMAASLIEDGETIILDAGTTTGALALELKLRVNLRVVTCGLTSLQVLAGQPGIELLSLGGTLRPVSLGFVGPYAELALRRMTADRVFLGCDGIVASRGICESADEQASLKDLMIAQASEIYVLATAEKLGRATSHAWTTIDRPWTLITDAGATPEQLEPFHKLGHVTIMRETKL